MEKLKIRTLSSNDNLEEITVMIRRAYKALLDKGFRYWGTYQTIDDTKKRFSDGEGFLAELENNMVGTITLKERYTGTEQAPWYNEEGICHFSQFAVLPEYQKTGLGSSMMNFVEDLARQKGFKEIALDTCENADRLIEYYDKRGYRFIEHVQWDHTKVNYRSVVLSKKL